MANIIDIYAAHGDGGERGIGPILAYFSHGFKAAEYAAGKGFYGSSGSTSTHKAIVVDNNVYVLAHANPVDIDGKQAARDKELRETTMRCLTAEQLRVLGLTD